VSTTPTSPSHPAYAPRRTYLRGVVAGINRGYFRRQIAEASYRFSEECEAGDRIIVGVNAYQDPDEKRDIDIRLACQGKPSSPIGGGAEALRGGGGSSASSGSTSSSSSLHPTNVMPALIDGALASCTLGEMVQAMADVYGRYTSGPEW
jgi:methylmalonyl-CoA mutase N-terminal domain/subunit